LAFVVTLVLLLLGSAALPAQDVVAGAVVAGQGSSAPQDTVHVVQSGETLWSIAERFLGTGHAWRRLAERNGIPTTSDHPRLAVGQRLVIPPRPIAGGGRAPVAGTPREAAAPPEPPAPALSPVPVSVATPPAVEANAVTGAQADSEPTLPPARRIGLVSDAERMSARSPQESRTVFHRELPTLDSTSVLLARVSQRTAPAPRLAEFEAAPHVVDPKRLEGLPRLIVHATARDREVAHLGDLVEVVAPRSDMAVGMRFAIVGALIPMGKIGAVTIPVGVLKITKAGAKSPILAEVVRQSGPISGGLRLLPITGAPSDPRPPIRMESPDLTTTVGWVDQEARTPSLQDYVLLDLGASRGVRAGDEFAVYATRAGVEQITVRTRVVRVDASTSAAIIIRQYSPNVTSGMVARRVAKAP
jgi:LysM repeat protein